MCHSHLHHHVQKKILFKRSIYRSNIKQTRLNKPIKLMSNDMEKNCSKSFFDASNSSDIEEEIIKQINMLKPYHICNLIRLQAEDMGSV